MDDMNKLDGLGSGGSDQMRKFHEATRLMKTVSAPYAFSEREPDRDRDPQQHVAWRERSQRAEFAHFVKALHQRGPDEVWDPRTVLSQPQYRNFA